MAKKQEFIEGDPLELMKKGWLGPDIGPEVFYKQFREMLGESRKAGAGYLAGATARAGYVPRGLAQRTAAIQEAGEAQAATGISLAMTQSQRQRYSEALDRYFRVWGAERQLEAQEEQATMGLWGGIGQLLMGVASVGMLRK